MLFRLLGFQVESSGHTDVLTHDFGKKEFSLTAEDGTKAYIKYEVLSDKELHFLTTQVPQSHQGKGVGKILVKSALDFCVKEQLKFKSSCWYIDAYIAKNPLKAYRTLCNK